MPGVRQSTSTTDPAFPGAAFIPPGGVYPRRIMGPWPEVVQSAGLEPVAKRPCDWLIETGITRYADPGPIIESRFTELHQRGGYLIVHLERVAKSADDDDPDHLVAFPEYWLTLFDSCADNTGFSLTPLWRAMYQFQLLRKLSPETIEGWEVDQVLLFEVRPRAAEVEEKPRRWWQLWR